jgi:hypothetical protein
MKEWGKKFKKKMRTKYDKWKKSKVDEIEKKI